MSALDLKFKTHYRVIVDKYPELPKGSVVKRCKWMHGAYGNKVNAWDTEDSVAVRLVGRSRAYENWNYVGADEVEEV